MATYTGLEVGRGWTNLINCKLKTQFYSHGIYWPGASIAERPIKVNVKFCDFTIGGTPYNLFAGTPGYNYSHNTTRAQSVGYYSVGYSPIYALNNMVWLDWAVASNYTTHGTSQYDDSCPVPTEGRILRVGPTRAYTTVWAAYSAAQHGDDIIIDAGTYNCKEFSNFPPSPGDLRKCVRFWGATGDPDDVILQRGVGDDFSYGQHWFRWQLYYMGNVPDEDFACGFFHLTLDNYPTSSQWETLIDFWAVTGTDENEWDPPVEDATAAVSGVTATGQVGTVTTLAVTPPVPVAAEHRQSSLKYRPLPPPLLPDRLPFWAQDELYRVRAALEAHEVTTIDYGKEVRVAGGKVVWPAGQKQRVILVGNTTLQFVAPLGACNIILVLEQDSTGGWSVAFPAEVHTSGGQALAISSGAGEVTVLSIYFDGTHYHTVGCPEAAAGGGGGDV